MSSYATLEDGVESGNAPYVLHASSPDVDSPDLEDLVLDPSCSCCCSCTQRRVGTTGSCCSWITCLIVAACTLVCGIAGAVIYSVNLVSHLLEMCRALRIGFIVVPIVCGVVWIFGGILMVRAFKHRQRQHQQKVEKALLLQEQARDRSVSVASLREPTKTSTTCTCRSAGRVLFSSSFWLIFIVLNVAILGAFGLLVYLHIHTLPRNSGTMSMNGAGMLSESVTIDRTDHNILHITSHDPNSATHSEYDLFYGQGIAHAQERLWQMEFQRAVGAGRLGELTGYDEDVVKIDKMSRTLNYYHYAEIAMSSLTTRSQEIINAYCDGINAYLAHDPLPLPLEFILLDLDRPRDFLPADILVWTKMVSYMLSGNLDKEILRWDLFMLDGLEWDRIEELLPKYDASMFPIVLEGEIPESDMTGYNYTAFPKVEPMVEWASTPAGEAYRNKRASSNAAAKSRLLSHTQSAFAVFRKMFGPSTASNNWVVGSNRTELGAPLMCNDPHLELMAPSIWILNHLKSPTFYAVGASFVGVPGVIIGHNANISWSVTNVGADVQDVFIMDGNYTHYTHNNQTFAYVFRKEVISVKHSNDIILTVRDAPHYGPVISELGDSIGDQDLSSGPALALRWTSLDSVDTTFDAFSNINTASNWDEFRAAIAYYRAPSQNMIYADAEGNIGYQMTGLLPIRPNNGTGLSPVPGTGQYDWQGWVEFEDMPHVYNPKKGYIATANNAVVPVGYKTYVTGDWDDGSVGYRARRITEMIVARDGHDVSTMREIQLDYRSNIAHDFLASVLPFLSPQTSGGQAVLASWLAWDGVASVGSVDAQRFERFFLGLQTLAGPETNSTRWTDPLWVFNTFSGRVADSNCAYNTSTASKPSCLAFASAQVDALAGRSEVSEKWGIDCHPAQFTHQVLGQTLLACIANRQTQHGGDTSTINVGTPDLDDDQTGATASLTQKHGPSYRHIIDWSDVDSRSEFIFGPGQSGNILSSKYDDLVSMWSQGEYLSMDPYEIVTTTLTIKP